MPLETKTDTAETNPLTIYCSDGAGQLAEFLAILHSPTGIAQQRYLEARSVFPPL
ncbi:RAD4, DNA repair protein RAD4, partial [Pyrenophora tritici-repentis]